MDDSELPTSFDQSMQRLVVHTGPGLPSLVVKKKLLAPRRKSRLLFENSLCCIEKQFEFSYRFGRRSVDKDRAGR